jgi:chlorobactene glucosyltransferase
MIYLILSTAFFIGGIFVVFWLHNQYQLDIVVEPAPARVDAPLISVCIPARNEERNIRACLESVLAQDYPAVEVIVLDDRSVDGTSEILDQFTAANFRKVSGSDLPPGWAGKPHALYQASAAARGEWLCFVDADTFLSPNALSACYNKAIETKADMFTIMTFQVLGSFWEKVVMPLVMTALSVGFSPRKVNDPGRRDAIANGQFILIKRSVYDAIGGHESVKDQIVEDKAISELIKWSGFRLIVADGRQVARTRMYTSLPDMWEGWTKNIYLGLRDSAGLLWLGVFGALVSLLAAVFVPIWPLLGFFWLQTNGGWMAVIVLLQSLFFWGYLIHVRAGVARAMDISSAYAITTAIGAAVFAAMMITSAFRVLSGRGVSWKGRNYSPK